MSQTPLTIRRGKEVRYDQTLDDFRPYHTDSPTPSKMALLLKGVDDGELATMVEMAEEIEGKDGHIQAIATQRRQAVTELEWEIEPKDANDTTAVEVAEYVQQQLESVDTWPETLEYLQTAIGPGVAVSEIIWHRGELVETNDVPGNRLIGNTANPNAIGIETPEHLVDGIPANIGKYIVHTPNCRAGYPLRVTLSRASFWPWVAKHHALGDVLQFSEQFGTPIKHFTYPKDATTKEVETLRDEAAKAGPDTFMVTAEGIKMALIESGKGTHPGEAINEAMDKLLSVLWLGQTLSTDAPDRGSYALGKVHQNTKASLTTNDIALEKRTIGRFVIAPMVRLRFPNKPVPMPTWHRIIEETRDLDGERMDMEQLRYAREFGLAIDPDDERKKLNLPMPKANAPPTNRMI